jgi:hypothetical protein
MLKRPCLPALIWILMALLISHGCSQQLSQQAKGNGASSPDEIGFQLHTSLKEDNFSSLVYYTPDSQVIQEYYAIETNNQDADTKRNIRHYAQHITEQLEQEFRQARQEATSSGLDWERARLDSVDVRHSADNPRFANVSIYLMENGDSYQLATTCVRIEKRWYISENIRFVEGRKKDE